MKFLFSTIVLFSCLCVSAQDTTYYFLGWGKPGQAVYVPRDSVRAKDFTQVKMVDGRPALIKRYTAEQTLQEHSENAYDRYGNHISIKSYYPSGQLQEELIFRNDPAEMTLFRTVFGPTFMPENSNFMIRREYNEYGRETGYFIIGVQGKVICSRVIAYREDRRKDSELLKDELNQVVLADRRYKYFDDEDRTVLEEFNDQGKMVQRVVLFDQHEIIQE